MSNNNKVVQIVMLPMNTIGYPSDMWQLGEHQHLYFTTDEPIQEGDWVFEQSEWEIKSVCQSMGNWTGEDHKKNPNDKKIVASTDPALGLPAIPKNWIKDVFVPSNGSIKEVELETFLWDYVNQDDGVVETTDKLKLTDNNEVVIVDEPTIETLFPKEQCGDLLVDQELEDAANKYSPNPVYNDGQWEFGDIINGFKAGAEWQKQQMALINKNK